MTIRETLHTLRVKGFPMLPEIVDVVNPERDIKLTVVQFGVVRREFAHRGADIVYVGPETDVFELTSGMVTTKDEFLKGLKDATTRLAHITQVYSIIRGQEFPDEIRSYAVHGGVNKRMYKPDILRWMEEQKIGGAIAEELTNRIGYHTEFSLVPIANSDFRYFILRAGKSGPHKVYSCRISSIS
ncbi:hypothetical protein HY345_03080 [Candidatus Microgenomates bacterium]|nr:hypothetical protein [Candidatus Microgenomates bacterium]